MQTTSGNLPHCNSTMPSNLRSCGTQIYISFAFQSLAPCLSRRQKIDTSSTMVERVMLALGKRGIHLGTQVPRVVITGMGVFSAIGSSLQEAWAEIVSGGCGIVALEGDEYETLPCKVAGKIAGLDLRLKEQFSSSDLRTMAPSTAMALIAAEEALKLAQWSPRTDEEKETAGVALGVGMVDLDDVCRTVQSINEKGYKKVSPYFVPRILTNMAAGQISIKYGLRGPNHSASTACATGAHSIGDAFRFITAGDAKLMLCGGAESCINPLSIAAFCRLRALATNFNDAPKCASRPFDKQRNGFVMGEGAAVLVLEELQHALDRNANIYAEVLGYGLSGDAAHLTAPSENGRGAVLAMERAIRSANLTPQDIGYVNAHATSTPLGDAVEVKAIRSVFRDNIQNLRVSSTKGNHGHLLGAAGNLESVFTVMGIHTGELPPGINLEAVEEDMELNYVVKRGEEWRTLSRDGRRVALKNAFGFGGTNVSLCFAQFKL